MIRRMKLYGIERNVRLFNLDMSSMLKYSPTVSSHESRGAKRKEPTGPLVLDTTWAEAAKQSVESPSAASVHTPTHRKDIPEAPGTHLHSDGVKQRRRSAKNWRSSGFARTTTGWPGLRMEGSASCSSATTGSAKPFPPPPPSATPLPMPLPSPPRGAWYS